MSIRYTLGALAALTVKTGFFELAGFEGVLRDLVDAGRIAALSRDTETIYAEGRAPEGHDADTVQVVAFRRV